MITIRDLRPEDHEAALALNNEAVPAVNALDAEAFSALIAAAFASRVAAEADTVVGLLVAFARGAPYASPNYAWFDRRYDDFLYVDRVVVAPGLRGAGIGRRLYTDLEALAGGRFARIGCEVNEEPPNPRSLRFHTRAGFAGIGTQETEGGAKRVRLMMKPLAVIDEGPAS